MVADEPRPAQKAISRAFAVGVKLAVVTDAAVAPICGVASAGVPTGIAYP